MSGRLRPALPPGPYLVVGMARSGVAAARALAPYGEVIGTDSGRPGGLEDLDGVKLALETEATHLVDRVQTVVKSPGVPPEAPVLVRARERGRTIVGELEIGWRLLSGHPFVAVTGTNGKTTTVGLMGAIYSRAQSEAAVAGNVGTPVTSLVGTLAPGATVICEASSFQLEDSDAFAPDAAVLLNLEEDHLDRHGSFAAYRAAKFRAFARQSEDDLAVVPLGFDVPGSARRVTFGGRGADVCVRDGALFWRDERVLGVDEIRLRGAHNLENAMAASAAALAQGLPADAVAAALAGFAGVPNRLEEVAEIDGVLYVNDSKATNVASARVGIEAFPRGIHLILGGSLKGGGFGELRHAVRSRCAACYLIGAASERLAADLSGTVPLRRSGDLARAVAAARAAARRGDVVLLSPACASYDQYRDFEERGEHFRALVRGA